MLLRDGGEVEPPGLILPASHHCTSWEAAGRYRPDDWMGWLGWSWFPRSLYTLTALYWVSTVTILLLIGFNGHQLIRDLLYFS